MKVLLVGLVLLLLVSGLAFSCKDDDSDTIEKLEERIRQLETNLGPLTLPGVPPTSEDWERGLPDPGPSYDLGYDYLYDDYWDKEYEQQERQELKQRIRRLEAELGVPSFPY